MPETLNILFYYTRKDTRNIFIYTTLRDNENCLHFVLIVHCTVLVT